MMKKLKLKLQKLHVQREIWTKMHHVGHFML